MSARQIAEVVGQMWPCCDNYTWYSESEIGASCVDIALDLGDGIAGDVCDMCEKWAVQT